MLVPKNYKENQPTKKNNRPALTSQDINDQIAAFLADKKNKVEKLSSDEFGHDYRKSMKTRRPK